MPAARAQRLCPEALFVPPDFTRYRAVSHAVREILIRSPLLFCSVYIGEEKALLAKTEGVHYARKAKVLDSRLAEGQLQAG